MCLSPLRLHACCACCREGCCASGVHSVYSHNISCTKNQSVLNCQLHNERHCHGTTFRPPTHEKHIRRHGQPPIPPTLCWPVWAHSGPVHHPREEESRDSRTHQEVSTSLLEPKARICGPSSSNVLVEIKCKIQSKQQTATCISQNCKMDKFLHSRNVLTSPIVAHRSAPIREAPTPLGFRAGRAGHTISIIA